MGRYILQREIFVSRVIETAFAFKCELIIISSQGYKLNMRISTPLLVLKHMFFEF